MIAVLVVALVGAGILLWALLPDNTDSTQAAPPSVPQASAGTPRPTSTSVTTSTGRPSSHTPTQRPSSAASPSSAAQPSTPPPSSQAPTSKAPGAVTGAELAGAVRDYYGLLPGNTDAGWARLTDRYRTTTAGSRATYEHFWKSVDAVQVRQADGSAPASVVATVLYDFSDGRRFEERTSYTLVRDGGVLKIDRSSVLSSRQL